MAAASTIHPEIGVEGHDRRVGVQFNHADEAGVRERHGNGGVLRQERAEREELAVDAKRNLEHPPPDEIEHGLGATGELSYEVAGFGEHGLARQQRRFDSVERLTGPCVVLVAFVEQGHDRPGVDDDAPHFPKPAMCLDAVDRSRGPASDPTRSPAAAAADRKGRAV